MCFAAGDRFSGLVSASSIPKHLKSLLSAHSVAISYTPVPILAHLGGHPIYAYGTFLALAFFAGFLLVFLRRKNGIDPDSMGGLLAVIPICAIIGSKLLYLALYADAQSSFTVGLVSYGGMIGASLGVYLYCRWKRLDFAAYSDALVFGVAIGIMIARVGCFLNWDDYGVFTTLPWGIDAGDGARHPTQLYHLLCGGILLLGLFLYEHRLKPKKGELGLFFFWAYCLLRFLVEFLRDMPRIIGLTHAQIACLIAGPLFFALWWKKRRG